MWQVGVCVHVPDATRVLWMIRGRIQNAEKDGTSFKSRSGLFTQSSNHLCTENFSIKRRAALPQTVSEERSDLSAPPRANIWSWCWRGDTQALHNFMPAGEQREEREGTLNSATRARAAGDHNICTESLARARTRARQRRGKKKVRSPESASPTTLQ